MPFQYFVDPINVCNLHCPLCPTGRGILARPRGRMSLSVFCEIIDQIAPYAYRIELYNWGEPLLHPEIAEMVAYAHQNRMSTGLSSNLNRLDAELAERLVRSGLSQLLVSIDGASQETYAAYRQGGSLEAVLRNVRLLADTRRALGSVTPFIATRMLVGKHNEGEIVATRRLAEQAGADSFATGTLYIDTTDEAQIEQWLPQDARYSAYRQTRQEMETVDQHAGGSGGETALQNEWACNDLWESMVINWDGGVAPCCWLHDPQVDFGNVSQESIRQIWNGAHYASARRAIGGRARLRPAQIPEDVPTICHRCRGHPHYMAY
jgi:MoaA/NifB/PqqE/SkfB family radical SAM enzyme